MRSGVLNLSFWKFSRPPSLKFARLGCFGAIIRAMSVSVCKYNSTSRRGGSLGSAMMRSLRWLILAARPPPLVSVAARAHANHHQDQLTQSSLALDNCARCAEQTMD